MSVWLKASVWILLIIFGFSQMEGSVLAQESSSAAEDSEAFQSEGSKEPKSKRPNILFAISDDQSYPHASAYGCNWVDTPAFDRVAKMGLLFNRCYTPNAKCAPSRACLVTGRYSWELEQAANHWCYFPSQFRSYVEVLGEFGYRTGMTGKGWAPGIAVDNEGKKRSLAGQAYSKQKAKAPAKGISSNDYAANFKDFLDSTTPEQPFCFWFGATEPHRRYEYGVGVRLGGKRLDSIESVPGFWPDHEVVRHDMLDYAFEVEHFDDHLGRMLQELEDRDMLGNTLVVVTSDNGMPFPRIKGQTYDWSHHLPLAICWAEGIVNPGRVVDTPVSFVDLAPTYLELAGVSWEQSRMAPVSGVSLGSVFRDEEGQRPDFVLIGKERHDVGRPQDQGYPVRGIIRDDFLMIRNFTPQRWPSGNPETGYLNTDGSPTKTEILNLMRSGGSVDWWNLAFGKRVEYELYDLEGDRDCLVNLADEPEYASRRKEMIDQMQFHLRKQGDPRVLGHGEVFDGYLYANERERGFYEKYLADPDSVRAGWVNPTDFEPQPVGAGATGKGETGNGATGN